MSMDDIIAMAEDLAETATAAVFDGYSVISAMCYNAKAIVTALEQMLFEMEGGD